MKSTNTEIDPTKKMQSSIKITGILLVILGIAGILLPQALSLAIEVFFGSLMIIAGVLLAYHNYQNVFSSFVNWLKPLILIVGGVLLLVFPSSGIAAIMLVLSFYFFTDAFASFGLSQQRYPHSGWMWMTFNGILSALLAILILIGWPQSSLIYLGIFVGISLLFDGIALFMLGRTISTD